MPGRVVDVVLDDEQRETLERWARRPKSSQALAFRCRIVLAAAEGMSSTEIAAELGCTGSTVGRWRGRFARRGLDGLHDEPRPGKPRTISDADVERVIVKTLEEHEGAGKSVRPVEQALAGSSGADLMFLLAVSTPPRASGLALPVRCRERLPVRCRERGRVTRLTPRARGAPQAGEPVKLPPGRSGVPGRAGPDASS